MPIRLDRPTMSNTRSHRSRACRVTGCCRSNFPRSLFHSATQTRNAVVGYKWLLLARRRPKGLRGKERGGRDNEEIRETFCCTVYTARISNAYQIVTSGWSTNHVGELPRLIIERRQFPIINSLFATGRGRSTPVAQPNYDAGAFNHQFVSYILDCVCI